MKHLFSILLTVFLCFSAHSQDSTFRVKMMHYNLLKFGSCDGVQTSEKYTWLGAILNAYKPDILTVNEILPAVPFANGIVQLSFTFSGNIEYANFTNFNGGDLANQIFYNSEKFGLRSNTVLNSTSIRDINIYELFFKPSIKGTDTTFLYVLDAHLKAGSSSSDVDDRWDACIDIMNWVQNSGQGKNIILAGDLNLSSANENAFKELVSVRAANVTLVDPLGLTSGWGSSSFAYAMTQSPRNSSNDCGVGGGMDDRFDFILPNKAIMDGTAGVSFVPGSYAAYGNDGDDYNSELDCSSNSAVNTNTCLSLRLMSDHLPVVMELDVEGFSPNTSVLPLLGVDVNAYKKGDGLWVSIEDGERRAYKLSLRNMIGQSVWQKTQSGETKLFYKDIQRLKGVFVLIIEGENGRRFTKKMMLN
ncbi:MAG: hypothetical protein MRZ79_06255 [Bacteroidia bacterium]|nr:hypothetical protein [Bacteroidia bacterium]